MNYYERHIGDLIKDTVGLTMMEDGAYNRLLDQGYQTEQPLPLDRTEIYRLARATTPAERKAADYVLGKYFSETPDGFVQKRIQAEIQRYHEKQRKARASADARWSKAKPQSEGNANASKESDASGMRTHSEGNALQTPDTNTQTPGNTPPKPPRKRRGDATAQLVSVEQLIAEGVGEQHAKDWLTVRAKKSLPLTPTAWNDVKAEAEKAGLSLNDAIKTATVNSWGGFKAKWLTPEATGAAGTATQRQSPRAARMAEALNPGTSFDDGRTIDMEAPNAIAQIPG